MVRIPLTRCALVNQRGFLAGHRPAPSQRLVHILLCAPYCQLTNLLAGGVAVEWCQLMLVHAMLGVFPFGASVVLIGHQRQASLVRHTHNLAETCQTYCANDTWFIGWQLLVMIFELALQKASGSWRGGGLSNEHRSRIMPKHAPKLA